MGVLCSGASSFSCPSRARVRAHVCVCVCVCVEHRCTCGVHRNMFCKVVKATADLVMRTGLKQVQTNKQRNARGRGTVASVLQTKTLAIAGEAWDSRTCTCSDG